MTPEQREEAQKMLVAYREYRRIYSGDIIIGPFSLTKTMGLLAEILSKIAPPEPEDPVDKILNAHPVGAEAGWLNTLDQQIRAYGCAQAREGSNKMQRYVLSQVEKYGPGFGSAEIRAINANWVADFYREVVA